MPVFRNRREPVIEINGTHELEMRIEDQTPKISLYERTREERIKENLERMQKLGLKELSLKLKPPQRTPRNSPSSSTPKLSSLPLPSGPRRRSSRLQNATPVSYSEAAVAKKDRLLVSEDVVIEEGSKPEVYTEEHEKLLGSTERSWTLFVDGYGADGKRIYDPINGKTCHQCRQKTLGYRTHCSKCKMVQGQFCGDCLYMRYGEHVAEAIENPNWVCPVCRGICNCSLCRNAKGWTPTGTLYKKISSLGYKSVAHYLIQTRLSQTRVGKDSVTVNQVSAKRSLPFSDNEAPSEELPQINDNQAKLLKPECMDEVSNVLEVKAEEEMPRSGSSTDDDDHMTTPLPMPMSSVETQPQLMESVFDDNKIENDLGLLRTETEDKTGQQLKVEEMNELHSVGEGNDDSNSALDSCFKLEEKHKLFAEQNDDALLAATESHSDAEQSPIQEVRKEDEMSIEDGKQAGNAIASDNNTCLKKKRSSTEADSDSIGARLRQRRRLGKDQENDKLADTEEPTSDVKQAAKSVSPYSGDSIGKRLRPRRKTT